VRKILEILHAEGHRAWLVGGAVRDLLLGLTPKDFDIATDATPEKIATIFPRTVAIGAHYGVMLVVEDGESTEVATFRKDGRYDDSRHPVNIEYADPEEDAKRRDFTINGLFWDPKTQEVIDFVDGKKDLEARIIRSIGRASARLQEDALRSLRAVRFLAQLSPQGFKLDENLVQGIKRQGHLILEVSVEKTSEEIFLILRTPEPSKAFRVMRETKLFERLFQQVRGMGADEFEHLAFVLDYAEQAWKEVTQSDSLRETYQIWAGFLQFFPDAANSLKSIHSIAIPKHELRSIRRLILSLAMIPNIEEMPIARLKEFLAMEEFFATISLYLANCRMIRDSNFEYLIAKRKEFLAKGTLDPEPLLNGEDLIELGFEPGPEFRVILKKVRVEQLEERIHTREEALRIVKTEQKK
jgi:poly(A) polymerase